MNELSKYWPSPLRITVGLYWLYFASQKWNGVDWMKSVIKGTADANPIPGLHQFLESVVAPNWFLFGVVQGVGETVVAVVLNAQVIVSGAGPIAISSFRWVPAYLR